MRIESIGTLLDWSKNLHSELAHSLSKASTLHENERARGLMEYVAGHEKRIAGIVGSFEDKADQKALATLVYDWETPASINGGRLGGKYFAALTYDQIAEEIFGIHNEVIELYRYLIGRSVIPQERELLEELLEAEEQETRLIAQQLVRGQDL